MKDKKVKAKKIVSKRNVVKSVRGTASSQSIRARGRSNPVRGTVKSRKIKSIN